MPTITDLKQRSLELFDSSLATAISAQIDASVHAPNQNMVDTFSLKTFGLADGFYASLKPGKFTGLPTLRWNGMDDFMLIPDATAPFSYTTSAGRRIEPKLMETDGGSIPRIVRGFKKYSSWGYGPAFIVHDWIFTAHKCGHMPDNNFSFDDAAHIMAEAIKTLMTVGYVDFDGKPIKLEKSESTLYIMYLAVDSLIAKNIWENMPSVTCYPKV